MILFCDSSALVKLYLVEPNSDHVAELAAAADSVALCRIAWAEAFAAFARRAREHPADEDNISRAKAAFADDWPRYAIVEATQALVEQAGRYAEAFALRGYDSLHLAAAKATADISGAPISFAAFDARLNRAASVLGLQTPFAPSP